jgi:hypothetical protein
MSRRTIAGDCETAQHADALIEDVGVDVRAHRSAGSHHR